MIKVLFIFVLAFILAWRVADVCIDDQCFPTSPVSVIPANGEYQVFLPLVAR